MPLLAEYDGKFPLYEMVTRLPPEMTDGDADCYAAVRNPAIESAIARHLGCIREQSQTRAVTRTPSLARGPRLGHILIEIRSRGSPNSFTHLTPGAIPSTDSRKAFRPGPTYSAAQTDLTSV